jgi:hypothetical protein
MFRKLSCALIVGIVAAAAVAPADAAPRRRVAYAGQSAVPATTFISRDESGRTRTKIILQKRSYLDGGTEVLPGQRKYTDYAIPPYYSPLDILGPGRNFDRQPLNARYESGGVRTNF